ncbi:MAG: hypothetical protein KBD44_00010 [Candidatus Pacebacteria bacterium]|nr:hypothetical protein [Candidatus Paceibacterota bacterium]
MSGIKDQAELDEMRKRLYERGGEPRATTRVHLTTDEPSTVAREWQTPVVPVKAPAPVPSEVTTALPQKLKKTYRTIILLATLAIFMLVLGVTGLYMFLGNNQISNENISVSISGPITVGGGETLPLEIKIENKNTVSIEGAVLILNLPPGTKSTEANPRDMLEERVSIGAVGAGEVITVPLNAAVFGEENQERQVKSTIEYRLRGSNGTFYKESEPFNFKINSSPVVIRINALKKVSAGQEIEVELAIQSNASTPLKDILVQANYPNNFEFSRSEPAPMYRESAWLLSEIKPEEIKMIKIRGVIVGQQAEEFQIKFSAGTPKPENQFETGSLLAVANADFVIEQPFINVGLSVNGTESEIVTTKTGNQTSVTVNVRNTLTDTLYDMAVEVKVAGNVLVRDRVNVQKGYYDSTKDVIRFDPSGNSDLAQVSPGETQTFSFILNPGSETNTPSFTLNANAYARRVSEASATEQLVGTAKTEVKFTSAVRINRELGRGTGTFAETGPFPPVADLATTYTVTLIAGAGGNDVTSATVATALPQYVSWQNQSSGDGTVSFNPVSKEIIWSIGDIDAGKEKQMKFQVGLLPSQTQIGSAPAILAASRFRATDRFTGDVVRADSAPLSTELSTEAGFEKGNGIIRRTVGAAVES